MITPLYVNDWLLDEDDLVPYVLDPNNATDAGIISEGITQLGWDGSVGGGAFTGVVSEGGTLQRLNTFYGGYLTPIDNVRDVFSGVKNAYSYGYSGSAKKALGVGFITHDDQVKIMSADVDYSAILRRNENITKIYSEGRCFFGVRSDGWLCFNYGDNYTSIDIKKISSVYKPVEFSSYSVYYTYFLQEDGTIKGICTASYMSNGQPTNYTALMLYIEKLTGIKSFGVAIDAGVFLRNDGTVFGYGAGFGGGTMGPDTGQYATWTGVKKLFVFGEDFYNTKIPSVIGLKEDGTLYYDCGGLTDLYYDRSEVRNWTNIKDIYYFADGSLVLGLKNDGSVVASACSNKSTYASECSTWTDIAEISCGSCCVFGVKTNGTVVYKTDDSTVDASSITSLTNVKHLSCYTSLSAGKVPALYITTTEGVAKSVVISVSTGYKDSLFYPAFAPWTDIKKLVIRGDIIAGLRNDGRVAMFYSGDSYDTTKGTTLQEVSTWTDIKDIVIETNGYAIYGLKNDGTVVMAWRGYYRADGIGSSIQLSTVQAWTNITQLAVSPTALLGLKSDKTVVATGSNSYGALDVSSWADIVQVITLMSSVTVQYQGTTYYGCSFGLKSDGTVVGCGTSYSSTQIATVTSWTDIVELFCDPSSSNFSVIGLKADKTTVSSDGGTNWSDIEHFVFDRYRIGVKSNGTVAFGSPDSNGLQAQYPGAVNAFGYLGAWVAQNKENNSWYYYGPRSGMSQNIEPIKLVCGSYTPGHDTTKEYIIAIGADGRCAIANTSTADVRNAINAWTDIVAVAIGKNIGVGILGLKSNGTCVSYGTLPGPSGSHDVSGWTNIVDIAAGYTNSWGVKADGTLVCVGETYGTAYNNMRNWTNVKRLEMTRYYSVALTKSGTILVSCVDIPTTLQGPPAGITDAVELFPGFYGCIVLRANGCVFFVGYVTTVLNISGWTNIVTVAMSLNHVVGLRSDGTVVAAGSNSSGQCDVSGWCDIVAIGCTDTYTIGVKRTGGLIFTSAFGHAPFVPVHKRFKADKINFKYPSGECIPFNVKRSHNTSLGNDNFIFTLKLNKSKFGSSKYLNVLTGTDATETQRSTELPILVRKKFSLSKTLNELLFSYTDKYHGRDLIFRRSDGSVLETYSREATLQGGNITQVEFKLSVPVTALSDITMFHGVDYQQDYAQATSLLPSCRRGVLTAASSDNPEPGVYWDYAALGTNYEVFGSDGLTVAENVLYIYSIEYLVSDGISSGETQTNTQIALGSAGEVTKTGESHSTEASLGNIVVDGVAGAEVLFGNLVLPSAAAEILYGGDSTVDNLDSQNTAQDGVSAYADTSSSAEMSAAGSDVMKSADTVGGVLSVIKTASDAVATGEGTTCGLSLNAGVADLVLSNATKQHGSVGILWAWGAKPE